MNFRKSIIDFRKEIFANIKPKNIIKKTIIKPNLETESNCLPKESTLKISKLKKQELEEIRAKKVKYEDL